MRNRTFWIAYLLLLVAQLVISNFFRVTPYVMLSILPVMVLCISTRINTFWTMLIAFASGLVVDLLSEGVLGLNALAIVPVAFLRNAIIQLIFGKELFARKEDFTLRSSGFAQVGLALLLAQPCSWRSISGPTAPACVRRCSTCTGSSPRWGPASWCLSSP